MTRKVCRESFCYWSLWCTPNCSRFRPVQNQAQRFFYPHTQKAPPISQALQTKGTIYRCGCSQFCLDPFLATPSSLQVCASCQWHLCKIPPRARIKDHIWSRLTLRDPTAHRTQLFQQNNPSVLLQRKSIFLKLLHILRTSRLVRTLEKIQL